MTPEIVVRRAAERRRSIDQVRGDKPQPPITGVGSPFCVFIRGSLSRSSIRWQRFLEARKATFHRG